jgi:hypothetical protein
VGAAGEPVSESLLTEGDKESRGSVVGNLFAEDRGKGRNGLSLNGAFCLGPGLIL